MSLANIRKIAIFPGTFDPITLGHVDLIERAALHFDTVIVAIAENTRKAPAFSLAERVNMCAMSLQNTNNIRVEGFSNLLVDFAKEKKAAVILRGLRAVSDFEYEFQLATTNRRLAPEIETMFLTPSESYSFLSSSLVREIGIFQGNLEPFVPAAILPILTKKWGG